MQSCAYYLKLFLFKTEQANKHKPRGRSCAWLERSPFRTTSHIRVLAHGLARLLLILLPLGADDGVNIRIPATLMGDLEEAPGLLSGPDLAIVGVSTVN